jgi:hypothetical protein
MKIINFVLPWLLVLGRVHCSKEHSKDGSVSIIPYPATLTKGDGKFEINSKTQIVAIDSGAQLAAFSVH